MKRTPLKRKTPLKRTKPMRRVGKNRAKENRKHDQIHETFMHYNRLCDCGCGNPAEERHHICNGAAARDASLYDTDVQLALLGWCHSAYFGDKAARPVEMQVAMKWAAILRKVNKYRGRAETAITLEEVVSYLEIDLARVAQLQRERKE